MLVRARAKHLWSHQITEKRLKGSLLKNVLRPRSCRCTRYVARSVFIITLMVIQGLEEFKLIEKMGDGAFSNVYKAVERKTGRKVAVKVVRKYEMSSSQVRHLSFPSYILRFHPSRALATPRGMTFLLSSFVLFTSIDTTGMLIPTPTDSFSCRMATSISTQTSKRDQESPRLVYFVSLAPPAWSRVLGLSCGPCILAGGVPVADIHRCGDAVERSSLYTTCFSFRM
jgi:hypothetical protein